MSTSFSSGNSSDYDVNLSTTYYPPGTLLTHAVKCVFKHEAISLGNFADLQRSCVPTQACPNLWKKVAERPEWTFVLHKTQDGVSIEPLGTAMRKDMQPIGTAHLPVVLWWRLYTLAEVFAFDEATRRAYSKLHSNCHHFVGDVLGFVAPAAYVHPLLERHAEVFVHWTSAVSYASGAATAMGVLMPIWAAVGAAGQVAVSIKDVIHKPPGAVAVEDVAAAQQELGVKVYLLSGMEKEGVSAEVRFDRAELWYLDSGDGEAELLSWSLLRRARVPPGERGKKLSSDA